MKLRPIKISGPLIDVRKLDRAITNGKRAAAKAVKADFDTTTQTFKHRPTFTIEDQGDTTTIATDDEVYGFLDDGTDPHIITAKSPNKPLTFGVGGAPKTTPRVIGSRPGVKGSTIVRAQSVNHPGTAARDFSGEIKKKWDQEFPDVMQRAIDSEV